LRGSRIEKSLIAALTTSSDLEAKMAEIQPQAKHHDNIFRAMKDIRFEDTVSHQCGITMNDSVEARAIADVMEQKDGVKVTYQPALIRIDGDPKLTFKMDEISEALGRPMTPHLFEISTSTHYGRMVMVDDNTVVIFGNLEEALAYEEYA
jgi:propane monooxygenase coupling protein